MNRRVEEYVRLVFEDLPYSAEVLKARGEIEAAMDMAYARIEEEAPDCAFETLIERHGSLVEMAALAGYTAEDVAAWRGTGGLKNAKDLKREWARRRGRVYLISFLWVIAGNYLLLSALFRAPTALIVAGMLGALAGLCHRKFRAKEEKLTAGARYDTDAFLFLRAQSDRYAKRMLNDVMLLFACAGVLVLSEVFIFMLDGHSKLVEALGQIGANLLMVEVPAYLCIKSAYCCAMLRRRIHLPERAAFRRHRRGVAAFSALYWLGVAGVATIMHVKNVFLRSTFIWAALVFAILALIYDLTLRRRLTFKNISLSGKRAAALVAAVSLVLVYARLQADHWYTQPYINSVARVPHSEHAIDYDEETGVYTITASTEDFRILHLTDIHLGGSLYSLGCDMSALKAVYAEIEHAKPDLVVVTGDLTYPIGIMSLSLNNSAPVSQFAAFMRNVGIPWAFTYGNHDTENMATLSAQDLNELYKSLSYKTSGTLLYPYVQPQITGRNNQLIELRNGDGTLRQALFLIDSNAYTGDGLNDYDYIHDDQVDWYAGEVKRLSAEAGETVPSMAFFHIPLQQYRTAYELYEQGSDEVKYFFGENGEELMDKVCCSQYPSRLFDEMVTLGSTKAAFCGHDHYNNMSLEYRGVRLTYGMSIDYLATPGIAYDTAQRGAELITIHADGAWEIEQIPYESICKDK